VSLYPFCNRATVSLSFIDDVLKNAKNQQHTLAEQQNKINTQYFTSSKYTDVTFAEMNQETTRT